MLFKHWQNNVYTSRLQLNFNNNSYFNSVLDIIIPHQVIMTDIMLSASNVLIQSMGHSHIAQAQELSSHVRKDKSF